MIPAPSPRLSGTIWFSLATVVALALWVTLWKSHYRPPSQDFTYEATSSSRWPQILPFTVPGVPGPAFFDLQVILYGTELSAAGLDPYQTAPAVDRPYFYNYPSVWLQLHRVGASLHWVRPLGLALAAAYLIVLLMATAPRDALTAICVIGLMIAPPSLCTLAMANNEIIIFLLLASAGVVWSRTWAGGWPALFLIAVAGVLKLYPACALAAFLDGRRRVFFAVITATAALALFFAANVSELASISRLTPRPHALSIGSQVLASRALDGASRQPVLASFIATNGGVKFWSLALVAVSALATVAIVAVALYRGWRDAGRSREFPLESLRFRTLFRLVALLYLGFFAIGHNWMQREFILILAVPWLLSRAETRPMVGLILAIGWFGGFPIGPIFLLVQGCTWALAATFAYWLARSLAPDIRRTLSQFHPHSDATTPV